MTTRDASTTGVAERKRVYIVGFAPSWVETPWDDSGAEYWGLNAFHRVVGQNHIIRVFTRWFQLHDLKQHHAQDHEHLGWLSQIDIPVYMWGHHVTEYGPHLKRPTAFPVAEVEQACETGYFTNSISWMLGLAILEGFEEISIYGVDMAMDAILQAEYSQQRPSIEYLVGYARGKGIKVFIPKSADILKTNMRYGLDPHDDYTEKLLARLNEVRQRQAQHNQQVAQHQQAAAQLAGAAENVEYMLRTWVPPRTRNELESVEHASNAQGV